MFPAQCQLGGNGGDDADGDGGNEGAGHIENRQGHAVNAPHGVGSGLAVAGLQQLAHVNLGFQHGHQLQSRRTQGDGDGNDQQTLGGVRITAGRLLCLGKQGKTLAAAHEQINGRDQTADGDTQNGAAGGQGDAVGEFQQNQGGNHTHNQLHDGFDHLGNGGGNHVALTLEEATVGTHHADQQGAGTKETDGSPGIRLILKLSQLAAEHRHQQGTGNAQPQENAPGSAVDPADLVVVVQGAGLGNHPAHGHRQSGGGDHQQHVVDVVGGIEVTEALLADDGVQGNLVQRAQNLYNGGGHGQQGGTLEKILLFLGFGHTLPPYLASSNRRPMAYSVSS